MYCTLLHNIIKGITLDDFLINTYSKIIYNSYERVDVLFFFPLQTNHPQNPYNYQLLCTGHPIVCAPITSYTLRLLIAISGDTLMLELKVCVICTLHHARVHIHTCACTQINTQLKPPLLYVHTLCTAYEI